MTFSREIRNSFDILCDQQDNDIVISGFPIKNLYTKLFLATPIHGTGPLVFLDLITLIIFTKKYKI
jgi:hypothetical protein